MKKLAILSLCGVGMLAASSIVLATCGGTCTDDPARAHSYLCPGDFCKSIEYYEPNQKCPANWVYDGECQGVKDSTNPDHKDISWWWSSSNCQEGDLYKKWDGAAYVYRYGAAAGYDYVKHTAAGACDCDGIRSETPAGHLHECKYP